MLNETAKKMAEPAFQDAIAANATIESFAIHTRQILDFLFAVRMGWHLFRTDLRAQWFFQDPASWTAEPSDFLKEIKPKVSKLVAHMTKTRAGIEAEEKSWEFEQIRAEVVPHLVVFANGADDAKLSEEARTVIQSLVG